MNTNLHVIAFPLFLITLLGCQSAKRVNLKYTEAHNMEIGYADDSNKTYEVNNGEVILENLTCHFFKAVILPDGINYGFEKYPPQPLLLSSVEDEKFQYYGPVLGGPYKVHFGLRKGGGDSAIWWEEGAYNVGKVKWEKAFVPDLKQPINAYKVLFIDSAEDSVFLSVEHYDLRDSMEPSTTDMKIINTKKDNSLTVGNHQIEIIEVSKNKIKYAIKRIDDLSTASNKSVLYTDPMLQHQSTYQKNEKYSYKKPTLIKDWSRVIKENVDFLERLKSIDRKSHVMNSTYDHEFYRWSYEMGDTLSKKLGNMLARKYFDDPVQWYGDELR